MMHNADVCTYTYRALNLHIYIYIYIYIYKCACMHVSMLCSRACARSLPDPCLCLRLRLRMCTCLRTYHAILGLLCGANGAHGAGGAGRDDGAGLPPAALSSCFGTPAPDQSDGTTSRRVERLLGPTPPRPPPLLRSRPCPLPLLGIPEAPAARRADLAGGTAAQGRDPGGRRPGELAADARRR